MLVFLAVLAALGGVAAVFMTIRDPDTGHH